MLKQTFQSVYGHHRGIIITCHVFLNVGLHKLIHDEYTVQNIPYMS